MTNSSVSSVESLKSALLDQNPFNEVVVRYQNIWGKGFLDVESLNNHASNAVFQAIEQNRTTSIVITAEYGTGKTHLISRIRHHLQSQGGALFVYANKYGDIQQIKQGFQVILADSLRNLGSQEVTQWQELATSMANQVFKAANPKNKTVSPKELVEKFGKGKPEQVNKWVNDLTKGFRKVKDVSDPNIVRAIFWTLSDEEMLDAVQWLAGQELAQFKANELRLPTQRQSFDAVLQILDLISEYNELVICFDELDNPDTDPDTGLTRAQVVAGLIKELFENLKRGVILSVMLPAVWKDKVKQMPSLSWRKISDYGEPLDLKFMDEDSVIDLVTLRLRDFYQAQNLVPPYSVYPFSESQLRGIGKTKSETVRQVLVWCKENLSKMLDRESVKPPSDPVEEAFIEEMQENIGNYLDDNFQLADALSFGFQTFIGQTVERVTIEEVTDKVCKNKTDKHLNFKIIGKENGQPVKIGVAVLQYAGGVSLSTGLGKLNDYKKFDLTRGCLVRSRSKKMTKPMESKYLEPLIREKGGEFVELKEDEIKPLIAIRAVHQKREVDYKLSEAEIIKFITEKGAEKMLGASNPLLKEILSDPSYEVPTDMIEEEPVVSEESMMADVSKSDNIEEGIDTLLNKINA
ncbi:ATP-binding protein [Funiculus sociatus GB2-A5]|uniref:ATP-binding protein n=1 Tax=Funiculus sociatus GB2-A5 TaxID=2933946 RepID=A0ABV0JRE6_9CYAN|nr:MULTISPECIES: P-loop NTPase fold protein [unclassified Trichocoleus]MBD1906178.1 ATP-binding protein [Trichocoleus sp. FACHB-832]MBD2061201.1 ATP-binding protein [Trichocoleus sp. FACHB-6]